MSYTLITVVLNDRINIEQTILSIINQSVNLEYIIIDGGSTDGTLDIIEKYKKNIDIIISDKDNGIYDAMNKAVNLSSSKWICFMNSGDTFFSKNSIRDLFINIGKNIDVAYGNHEVEYLNKKKVVEAKKIDKIWQGMVFSHQSSFTKRDLLLEYKFNIKNKITADYEFFYILYRNKKVFKYVPTVVSSIKAGGVSDIKRIQSLINRWSILPKNLKVNVYYLLLIVNEVVKRVIKFILKRIKNK